MLSKQRSVLRCPHCLGQIIIKKTDVYEDDNIIKIIIIGKCSWCGAPYRYEKIIRKDKYIREYLGRRIMSSVGVSL
jgi:DNA-directed RNA polymerase subunit RPC12/RpoP